MPALPSESAVILGGGLTRFSAPRFLAYALVAAIGWAVYVASLGYPGGRTFRDTPWLALLIALGIAFAIALGSEAFRKLRDRRAP